MHEPSLVAYYTSQLDQSNQITIYSKFLSKMTSPEQRELGLSAAEKFSLPVDEITKRIIEMFRYTILIFLIYSVQCYN